MPTALLTLPITASFENGDEIMRCHYFVRMSPPTNNAIRIQLFNVTIDMIDETTTPINGNTDDEDIQKMLFDAIDTFVDAGTIHVQGYNVINIEIGGNAASTES